MTDYRAIKGQILDKLDIHELEQWGGIRFTGKHYATDFIECHDPYSKDARPSAGIYVGNGPGRFTLKRFQFNEVLSFWDLARDFHPRLSGYEFKEILQHYAEQTGVELPKKSKIVATYDYTDPDGNLLFQVCRMDPKDFRQRRPDPEKADEFIWGLGGIKPVLYRLPEVITGQQLLICEGEKDADRLFDAGFTATTCPMGAGKWRKSYNPYLKGKDIIILCDNDSAGHGHVAQVSNALWGVSRSIKVLPPFPDLPPKGDVSDWLDAGHTAEDLRRLINSTEPLKEKPEPPPPSENKTNVMGTGPERRFFIDGKFAPVLLCNEFTKHHDCVFNGSSFFLYQKAKGFWQQVHDNAIGQIIKEYLGIMATKGTIADAQKIIEIECYTDSFKASSDFLNCTNGMLDISSRQLLPHDRKYNSTIQIPSAYEPQATCPAWTKYLSELFPNCPGKIKTLQEFTGYALYPKNFIHKALFNIGAGSNGKSLFVNIISGLFGSKNISSVELHQMGNRFLLAELQHKALNICSEMDSQRKAQVNVFKQIVSGDTIQADIKNRNPISFRPTCKLIFNMNEPPVITDRTFGFSRRIIVIQFDQKFEGENEDIFLEDKLIKELPGILNWCLDGLNDVLTNKRIHECEESHKEKEAFLMALNPVKQFVEDCCSIDYNATITKQDLYLAYKHFCEESNLQPLGRYKFYDQLSRDFNVDEFRDGNRKPWSFRGIDILKQD